jgi:hypothetical protein
MFNGDVIIRNGLIISMAYVIYVGDSVRRRRSRRRRPKSSPICYFPHSAIT